MANYKIISSAENIKWPAYVTTVSLDGEQLEKAYLVLEKALVTLEAYGGPHLTIASLKWAKRTGIFLYEINCNLVDNGDVVRECIAMILYEPWMKANCIATASFQFGSADGGEKLIMKRKKSIRYYKESEMIHEEFKKVTTDV